MLWSCLISSSRLSSFLSSFLSFFRPIFLSFPFNLFLFLCPLFYRFSVCCGTRTLCSSLVWDSIRLTASMLCLRCGSKSGLFAKLRLEDLSFSFINPVYSPSSLFFLSSFFSLFFFSLLLFVSFLFLNPSPFICLSLWMAAASGICCGLRRP